MKNHFHMVCKNENLSNIIRSIKSFSAKKIIENLQKQNNLNLLHKFELQKKASRTDTKYQIW